MVLTTFLRKTNETLYMDYPQGQDGDFIVRTRNVLWREVARSGGTRELARAHVNLPSEAVKALELESKGDTIAFIIRKNSKNVTLTNSFESQPTSPKWEKDPQYLLERLLSRVIILKSRKGELLEKWEDGEIDNQEFTEKTQEIRYQLNTLTENLKRVQDTQFRGSSTSTEVLVESKTQADYNEYAAGMIDYTKDLASKIQSTRKRIDVLSSAHSHGLITDSEYRQEKEELESLFSFLTDFSDKALNALQGI
jgi:hypothetical protein